VLHKKHFNSGAYIGKSILKSCLLFLIVLFTGCDQWQNSPLSTSTISPPPTITPLPPNKPPPSSKPKPMSRLADAAALYRGPDNENFEQIAYLSQGKEVYLEGEYGDFVMVIVPIDGDLNRGFVWKEKLTYSEKSIPQLDQDQVPLVEIDLLQKIFDPMIDRTSDGDVVLDTDPDEWYSLDLGPISIKGPFEIEFTREHQGEYGSFTMRGNHVPYLTEEIEAVENGDLNWPIPQIFITDERVELSDKDLSKGGGPFYSENVTGVSKNRLIIRFYDEKGQKFSIFDQENNELFSLDLAELYSGSIQDGLFPGGFFYPGIMAGPDTEMKLYRMILRYPPSGEYNKNIDDPHLRDLAEPLNLLIGAGTITYHLTELTNAEILSNEFNYLIVAQFAWIDIQPERGVFVFDQAEAMLEFAEYHGMTVQCADLISPSPQDLPDWLVYGSFTRDDYEKIVEEHIDTVVNRFKGRCDVWSVVNEEVARNLSLPGGGFWINRLGEQIYELAFRFAYNADPSAILLLKESNAFDRENYWTRITADELYRIAKHLVEEGVPIDGVAFQMHVLLADNHVPTKTGVMENMRRFEDLGLDIYFDEIDVNLGNIQGSQEERWEFQANIYRDMLEACLELDACRSFSFFHYTDRHSWLGDCENCRYIPNSEAHPFDKYYNPKPAYYSMLEVLSSHYEHSEE